MYLVTINKNLCNGCGECVDICPVEIISLEEDKAFVEDSSDCFGCESCVLVCPSEAVKVEEL